MTLATEELHRYVDANDLSVKEVKRVARQALETLEETPMVDGRTTKSPTAGALLARAPFDLTKEVRLDLKSDSPLSVLRALHTVKTLQLTGFALDVLAVIYRTKHYDEENPIFGDAPRPLRSVAIKWLAGETLRSLASMKP
jgi:hypothetical protein